MDDERQPLAAKPCEGTAPTGAAARRAWSVALAVLAAELALLLWLFRDAVAGAVRVWNASETYTHCYLIVPIVLYLLWDRRAELAQVRPRPLPAAALLLLPFAAAWLVGHAASVLELQQLALVAMIQVVLLAVLGWPVYRVAWFAFLYLFFLVPTGEWLVPALQDFTADFTVGALRLAGIPTYHDGIYIFIPNGSFKVAEACAGLRFLIATIAYGFLFAYLVYRSWTRRLVFALLSFVVPVIANGFRAFGIVILAHVTDNQVAVAADHIVYGWVFFSFVLLLLTWIGFWFREDDVDRGPPLPPATVAARPGTARGLALAGLLVAAGIAVAPAYAGYLAGRVEVAAGGALPAPAVRPPWQPAEPALDWRPSHPGADAVLHQAYARGDEVVHLHVGYFDWQRDGAKAVSSVVRTHDDGTWRSAGRYVRPLPLDDSVLLPAGLRLHRPGRQILVVHWYWVNDEYTSNMVTAKLLQLRSTLLQGEPAAAHVLLAAPYGDDPEEARSLIEDFLAHAEPLRQVLRGGRR